MSSPSPTKLREQLCEYGVPSENVRLFSHAPQPHHQNYLSLVALRRVNRPAPDGVAEYQNRPVLYFVDETRFSSKGSSSAENLFSGTEPQELPVIFRQIACRGERAYLARIEPGRLLVAPVSPTDKRPDWVEYKQGSAVGKSLFSRLAFGITEGEDFGGGDAVFDRLFALIKQAANGIAKTEELRPDALSLVGRALFFRFLKDRGVLDGYSFKRIAPRAIDWTDCFANPANAASTCAWLDRTFNGDFLPLRDRGSEKFFERVNRLTDGEIFQHLSAVVRGHEPFGSGYQALFKWDWAAFDFAQIPVGLLSQVYEAFSWEWTPKEAQSTSQRYTPRNVAIALLDEVLDQLPAITNSRILDPACGAGVFLVLAFRRLYLERWKAAKGKARPGTEAIRDILDNQLVGLDISEAALKLAALSLYLTAVELDPEPLPPDKLKFNNLHGRVLFNVREPGGEPKGAALGSLSPHLGKKFDNKFDVVVSNPPWTSVDAAMGGQMAELCRSVIAKSDPVEAGTHRLPDNNPDLPFLWKATEWCKGGGRIAMALPARILLKTEPIPSAARAAIFKLIQLDGIINGTNLSDTKVWPGMNQPWLLLFATNQRPSASHQTYVVTIPLEGSLNDAGQFRIDAKSARPVSLERFLDTPWIWKALSVGTDLDIEVISKIKRASSDTLEKYWRRVLGPNRHGKGYTRGDEDKWIRDAKHLKGLPNLNSTGLFRFVVHATQLPTKFNLPKIQWPRRESIYEPPLVLIRESPGEDRREGRGLLCWDKIAYIESFSGYSAAGHPDGNLLVRYLHLFIHSNVWLYYVLLTSPQFGAERRRFHKADLEHCPFPSFEALSSAQRIQVDRLSRLLEAEGNIPWQEIDRLFAQIYGLSDHDLQVMHDTLAVALPYGGARLRACSPPTEPEQERFVGALVRYLRPLLADGGGQLKAERYQATPPGTRLASPFELIRLSGNGSGAMGDAIPEDVLRSIIDLADESGASEIVMHNGSSLTVGIYNQYRYWTPSRARLMAGEIVREYLDVLVG